MATWHQNRRPVRLYHATLWTVVDDPPNDMRGSMLFRTESEAQEYIRRRAALGTGRHCYVLPPHA